MKLDEVRRNIQKTGEFSEDYFDIGDKAMIMSILREKMYSNPIKAICQEIMSNGRDAHREMGKDDVPIEVKLPNRLDPEFYIRDFGPGISPERMTDIFIKYGASTKRADNVQTGGFGLGAKTPFAYTDTFTIVSITPSETFKEKTDDGQEIIHNNVLVRRQYIAYIDETGIGKMLCASSNVSDEPQGTKISITAQEQDFYNFEQWVRHVGKYWKVQPDIKGYPEWEWKEINKEFEGENWIVEGKDNNYYGSQDRIVAIVDGIPYTVNQNSFPLSTEHRLLSYHRVRMFFDVGDLSVTANREDLDYGKSPDSKTNKKLAEVMDKIYDEIEDKLQDKIADAKNLFEAKCQFKRLKREFSDLVKSVKWNDIVIDDSNMSVRNHNATAYRFDMRTNNSGNLSLRKKEIWAVDFLPDSVVAFNDTGTTKGTSQRVQTLFNNDPDLKWVYLILPPDDPAGMKKTLKSFVDNQNFDKFEYTKLSTVDKSKVARGTGSRGATGAMTRVRIFNRDAYYKSTAWTETQKDLQNDSGVYVEIKNRVAIVCGEKKRFENLQDIMRLFPDLELYGIPTRFVAKAGPKWVKFEDYMRAEFDKLVKDQTVVDSCFSVTNGNKAVTEAFYATGKDIFSLVLAKLDDKTTDFAKYIELSYGWKQNKKLYNKLNWMAQILGITINIQNAKADFAQMYQNALEKYPLISEVNFYSYSNKEAERTATKVADYINAIDLYEKMEAAKVPDDDEKKGEDEENDVNLEKELQTV